MKRLLTRLDRRDRALLDPFLLVGSVNNRESESFQLGKTLLYLGTSKGSMIGYP